MITKQEFDKTVIELNNIKYLTEGWGGRKQNNFDDDKVKLFYITKYNELIKSIKEFPQELQDYYIKRWFMIKVSECDEYLISKLPNTEKNPDRHSKKFDFIIKGLPFDIKGTRIPRKYWNDLELAYAKPIELIRFYYYEQSKGRRYGIQNRLFLVTVDEDNLFDEWKLRLNFQKKKDAFLKFINNMQPNRKYFEININNKKVIADIIFVIKNGNNIRVKIASDLIN